jgi:hypothetical protein
MKNNDLPQRMENLPKLDEVFFEQLPLLVKIHFDHQPIQTIGHVHSCQWHTLQVSKNLCKTKNTSI